MKKRRNVRSSFPGFQIALPAESIFGEVQVQQKSDVDANSFFINVDDATVSPMITTGPTFGLESGKRGPVSPQPSPSGTAGKFFHVNNTNIFVLLDGISMFVEGKSTFDGEDPLVVQQAVQKRRNRPEATNGCFWGEDTVEAAIRDIQKTADKTSGAAEKRINVPPPKVHTVAASAGAKATGAPLRSQVTNTSLNRCTVLPTHASSKLSDFFKDAVKPHNPAPFGKLTVRAVREVPSTELPTGTCSPASLSQTASKGSPTTHSPTGSRPHISGLSYIHSSTDVFNQSMSSVVSLASRNSDMHSSSMVMDSFGHKQGSTATTLTPSMSPRGSRRRAKCKKPFVSENDIGMSNRSLDLDNVEVLNLLGVGSQGKVYRVMVDGKLYALKRIDVKEATEAANSIERQGRKRGLVKELHMINLQRSKKPPQYLMSMFNAVATVDNERQHLSVLMELMSFSFEDVQHMIARIPQTELNKITQSSFKNHLGRTSTSRWQQEVDMLMRQQPGSCMHVMGRNSFNGPEEWEYLGDRQTTIHEIILSMLAHDVLRGLAELHEDYHMVHCDLKPANILLAFDMQHFKLTDFGCGSMLDAKTQKVRRKGVDLGSKLYKAPERLMTHYDATDSANGAASNGDDGGEGDETFEGCDEIVEFTAKADVWSLGIVLLELASGVHPCQPFKSDYWNYINLLKLPRMSKPLNWSNAFSDFIVRCVNVDVDKRWSVQKLQGHPFITKYETVPRNKLKVFIQKLESESANFQRKQQKEILEEQIRLSTMVQARDNHKWKSMVKWRSFTGFLRVAPQPTDTQKFPHLGTT
ncbi:protein kinase [Strigomonas culicis]|uniref:mitogen-activated protein kinase kinase n=1 Tax=Strigomonas culicis TaxID=28005 RepID=S9TZ48_9TRYP|nr:protein kinase [Strigomonas culicis]|eukprot:EPY21933.1 protein kinase [Strigomonas culicis]